MFFEGGTDDDTDGQLDDVTARDVLESLDHGFRVSGRRERYVSERRVDLAWRPEPPRNAPDEPAGYREKQRRGTCHEYRDEAMFVAVSYNVSKSGRCWAENPRDDVGDKAAWRAKVASCAAPSLLSPLLRACDDDACRRDDCVDTHVVYLRGSTWGRGLSSKTTAATANGACGAVTN